MHDPLFARLGLVIAQNDPHAAYYREVLEHAGLSFDLLDLAAGVNLTPYDVLLLCGEGEVPERYRDAIQSLVRTGGSLMCSGGLWGLDELLGLEPVHSGRRPASEIVFPVHADDKAWPEKAGPARFFGGCYARATQATPIAQTSSGSVAASRYPVGKGLALGLMVHVGRTIAHMCLGRSVETKAIGPCDGSASFDGTVLRAEDGITLSFENDRTEAEHGQAPFFSIPHADIVRELWTRMVLEALEHTGKRFTMIWPWPEDAQGAACISVDCEEFDPINVASLHSSLAQTGANAAWLVSQPGYTLDVYRNMRKWDHEVGILFAADEDGNLCEERLKIQHVAMSRMVAVPIVGSLRVPDGGWYRLDRLYDLADHTGSKVSLSKGGRQPGTTGFAFGTCIPFHPIRRDGHSMRVLEIPYQIFMPGLVASELAVTEIIEQTVARHGCFHMAITSTAHHDGHVALILRRAITVAKKEGLLYMLPSEIARFERARRTLRTKTWSDGLRFGFDLVADDDMDQMTLLVSGEPVEASAGGKSLHVRTTHRLGRAWTVIVTDVTGRAQMNFEFHPFEDLKKAA